MKVKYILAVVYSPDPVLSMKKSYPLYASIIFILAALVISGCTDDDGGDEKPDLTVEINYEGTWEGAIVADGETQEISGEGEKTIDVSALKVSVNVTRTDGGSGSININIMEGDLPLTGTSSMDEFVTLDYDSEE